MFPLFSSGIGKHPWPYAYNTISGVSSEGSISNFFQVELRRAGIVILTARRAAKKDATAAIVQRMSS
jgi:hypothetical protein